MDQLYLQAFDPLKYTISLKLRGKINRIRDNNEKLVKLSLTAFDARSISTMSPRTEPPTLNILAWELIGKYIANNTHLLSVDLDNIGLSDVMTSALFRGLTGSISMRKMVLGNSEDYDDNWGSGHFDAPGVNLNQFGIDGVRAMVPFLKNSPKLTTIMVNGNVWFNTECLNILMNALAGKGVKTLDFEGCSIYDISALETYNLPNLRHLDLSNNIIGRNGCTILAGLLQNDGSKLVQLHLKRTGLRDEDIVTIANSLKHNTKLKTLYLGGNNAIGNRGYAAFLKLLVDVSSIENTYNSNHILRELELNRWNSMNYWIDYACINNRRVATPHTIGRENVIRTQLHSHNREELCRLQGVEYSSIPFADIDSILLPHIIALIGRPRSIFEGNRHTDLYTALKGVAPELLSYHAAARMGSSGGNKRQKKC